jgi:hypothetical protein
MTFIAATIEPPVPGQALIRTLGTLGKIQPATGILVDNVDNITGVKSLSLKGPTGVASVIEATDDGLYILNRFAVGKSTDGSKVSVLLADPSTALAALENVALNVDLVTKKKDRGNSGRTAVFTGTVGPQVSGGTGLYNILSEIFSYSPNTEGSPVAGNFITRKFGKSSAFALDTVSHDYNSYKDQVSVTGATSIESGVGAIGPDHATSNNNLGRRNILHLAAIQNDLAFPAKASTISNATSAVVTTQFKHRIVPGDRVFFEGAGGGTFSLLNGGVNAGQGHTVAVIGGLVQGTIATIANSPVCRVGFNTMPAFSVDDWVVAEVIGGMTLLNDVYYRITALDVAQKWVELETIGEAPGSIGGLYDVDTTDYPAYTSGGTLKGYSQFTIQTDTSTYGAYTANSASVHKVAEVGIGLWIKKRDDEYVSYRNALVIEDSQTNDLAPVAIRNAAALIRTKAPKAIEIGGSPGTAIDLTGCSPTGAAIHLGANKYIAFDTQGDKRFLWDANTSRLQITNMGTARFIFTIGNTPILNLSGGGTNPEIQINGTKVVSTRKTGWGTVSGTLNRSALATYTGPNPVSGTYNTTEQQALVNAVQDVSRRLGALMTDLTAHGLIGP